MEEQFRLLEEKVLDWRREFWGFQNEFTVDVVIGARTAGLYWGH